MVTAEQLEKHAEIQKYVTQLVKDSKNIEFIPRKGRSVKSTGATNHVRWLPDEWVGVDKLERSGSWGSTYSHLLFEFENKPGKKLFLKLTIGKKKQNDEYRRKKLYDAAKSHGYPFLVFGEPVKEFSDSWIFIYKEEVLGSKVVNALSIDALKLEVKNWWAEFLDETYPVLVKTLSDRLAV